jgi:hypothetical protein
MEPSIMVMAAAMNATHPAGVLSQGHHLIGPTGLVSGHHGDHGQADHQHDHLDEIGPGHGQHPANQHIDQHQGGADDHAHGRADFSAREYREHQAQGRDLRRHPAQVTQDDGHRAEDFNALAKALAVEVTDGQQAHLVELGRKEGAHQHQAHRGAKGILDHGIEAALDELGGDAHHRLGPEPGGKGSGDHHGQWQAAARDGEVRGALDACTRVDANAHRAQQVQDHKRKQSGVHVGAFRRGGSGQQWP